MLLYIPILGIWACAAVQIMVLRLFGQEQGILVRLIWGAAGEGLLVASLG